MERPALLLCLLATNNEGTSIGDVFIDTLMLRALTLTCSCNGIKRNEDEQQANRNACSGR